MTPLQAQRLTLLFIVAVTILVATFDFVVIRTYGPDASISRVSARLFGQWPTAAIALVFWLGVLVGHVWLPAQ
jgi:hypothetical protein